MGVLAHHAPGNELGAGHHGMTAIHRKVLVLQHRAREAGLLGVERSDARTERGDDGKGRGDRQVAFLHAGLLR